MLYYIVYSMCYVLYTVLCMPHSPLAVAISNGPSHEKLHAYVNEFTSSRDGVWGLGTTTVDVAKAYVALCDFEDEGLTSDCVKGAKLVTRELLIRCY